MMMNLSGDSKANIDKILEEFRNAKMVKMSILSLFSYQSSSTSTSFVTIIVMKHCQLLSGDHPSGK